VCYALSSRACGVGRGREGIGRRCSGYIPLGCSVSRRALRSLDLCTQRLFPSTTSATLHPGVPAGSSRAFQDHRQARKEAARAAAAVIVWMRFVLAAAQGGQGGSVFVPSEDCLPNGDQNVCESGQGEPGPSSGRVFDRVRGHGQGSNAPGKLYILRSTNQAKREQGWRRKIEYGSRS